MQREKVVREVEGNVGEMEVRSKRVREGNCEMVDVEGPSKKLVPNMDNSGLRVAVAASEQSRLAQ